MSLLTSLSIARQGIAVSQLGLQLTAQNVANVNTEGYKRQRLIQVNMPYGLGVAAQSIQRVLDPLAERRLLGVTSSASSGNMAADAYSEMENLFNDLNGRGLDDEFQDFFQSLQDLASAPGGQAERATLRSRGESITRTFEFLRMQMENLRESQDIEIESGVAQANEIVRNIAELNRNIAAMSKEIGYNELLNNRDEWVRKLSELMPVTARNDKNGNFILFIEGGMPLVSGTECHQLDSRPDPTDALRRDIFWKTQSGVEMVVTDQMTSGRLGGALRVRDTIVPEQMRKLDATAAEFVLLFNRQHRAGMGLDSVGGRDFFATLPVNTQVGKGAQGSAVVTATSIIDDAALTLDDYEIRFTSPATFEVVNVITGAIVPSTPPAGAYTAGVPITFDGLSVTIAGVPQTGDFFQVSIVTGAAGNMQISSALAASLDAIAAGFTGETGDNENALLLADMENQPVAAGGTLSFRQLHQNFLVELGVASATENLENDTQETILTQITNMVESVSGVSIDEETTSLMAYQRAFQASAKVIEITDELMATIIQML